MRHPAIVTFYGIYLVDEKTYMVVELCSLGNFNFILGLKVSKGSAHTLVQGGELNELQLLAM
jgi:serine/threonine protein kinase